MPELIIRPARASDIPEIVRWARSEEFAPGFGDVDIYRNTDKQGVWMGPSKHLACLYSYRYQHHQTQAQTLRFLPNEQFLEYQKPEQVE